MSATATGGLDMQKQPDLASFRQVEVGQTPYLECGDAVVGGINLAEDVLGVVVGLLEGLLRVAQPRVHLLCDLLNNQGIINCISYDYILYTG